MTIRSIVSSVVLVSVLIANPCDAKSKSSIGSKEQYVEISDTLEKASSPLDEARAFLKQFVREMNAQYGTQLTVTQACALLRENLHLFEIPADQRKDFLEALQDLETEDPHLLTAAAMKWNWEWFLPWKWFEKKEDPFSKVTLSTNKGKKALAAFVILCVVGATAIVLNPPAGATIVASLAGVAATYLAVND